MATLLSSLQNSSDLTTAPASPSEEYGLSVGEPVSEDGVDTSFSIAQFLFAEQEKDLLRLSTAGSVDDGKSTLIGRLLYDSRNVYEDHVRSVTKLPGTAASSIDFAQLTDGLRAEREQGITIDVAYRYFSTERRKFIIADTPGHEQYTRNMATGASTADLAIILIDASKGILTQSRRHVYITSLLGIRHLVAAINKMDLVDYSPEVFKRIEAQFTALVAHLGKAKVKGIPMSALLGDNVVERSAHMPWYSGPTLLEHLERVPTRHQLEETTSFRLPVQRVIRPRPDYPEPNFRGFAGRITAGSVHVGDRVIALPSGRSSRVASISTFDGNLEHASAPQSVAITLQDELDISRGDFLSAADHPPQSGTAIRASLVWFDGRALDCTRSYLLKHATQTIGARVASILHRVNVQTLAHEAVETLSMNEIGLVEIDTVRPIFFDPYEQNRVAGSFILIDPDSNATAAAGMIQGVAAEGAGKTDRIHKPATLLAEPAVASELESVLLAEGCAVVRTRLRDTKLWRSFEALGLLTIVETSEEQSRGVHLAVLRGAEPEFEPLLLSTSDQPAQTVSEIVSTLRANGILIPRQEDGQA